MSIDKPYLKKANTIEEFTGEQVLELKKCMQDPVYFTEKYCRVPHPVKGDVPLKLHDYQKNAIKAFAENRNTIFLAPRQVGKTTIATAFLLWFAIFNFEKTILIVSNKNDNSKEIIFKIKYLFERLPSWLKPGLNDDGYNKHALGFDNGTRIISQATSENSGRGMAISLLFCLGADTSITVRDKITGEVLTLPMEAVYNLLQQ